MPKMVEVVIESVRVSLTNQQRIVVLREMNAERYLPIWIGPYEAESITIAMQEVEVARPQTHDLLRNIIQEMGGRLQRVEVVTLKDDVFFGNLIVDLNGETLSIDSRPSDAIALAARCRVPILISAEVLDTAGIIPEEETEDEKEVGEPESAPPEEPASKERLSVFEDFLQNLDLDDKPPKNQDDEDDEEKPKDEG